MKEKIIKWIKERLVIIVVLAGFFLYPYAVRVIEPTAATYDAGVLQIIVYTILIFVILQLIVWQVINGLWSAIAEYFKFFFNNDFKELDKWQKIKVSLFIYFALFAAMVMLSRVIS